MKSFIIDDVQKNAYFFDRTMLDLIRKIFDDKNICEIYKMYSIINKNIGQTDDFEWPIKNAIIASV